MAEDVTVPRAEWEAMLAEQRSLRERLDALEGELGRASSGLPVVPSDQAGAGGPVLSDPPGLLGRRKALVGLAGAAVGGVAAAVAAGQPAAAATGDVIRAGQTTTATNTTVLDGRGTAGTALWVRNDGGSGFGMLASTTSGQAFRAYSVAGMNGAPTAAMENGSDGRALLVSSDGSQLRLLSGTAASPPSLSADRLTGDMAATSTGELWFCVNGGRPGTWRKLTGRTAAGAFHVLPTPVRVYDSRPGTPPDVGSKTKLGTTARTLDLKANASGVPAGATAAVLTVLLVDAAEANGTFTLWANGVTKPAATTMVWGGSARRFTTTAVSALDSQARCQVVATQLTNLVVDVVGYYR